MDTELLRGPPKVNNRVRGPKKVTNGRQPARSRDHKAGMTGKSMIRDRTEDGMIKVGMEDKGPTTHRAISDQLMKRTQRK